MTQGEREFLKTQIDEVVLLETTSGRRMLAQILIVFDEGDTPDLFCLEVEPTQSGYVQRERRGTRSCCRRSRAFIGRARWENQASYVARKPTGEERIVDPCG